MGNLNRFLKYLFEIFQRDIVHYGSNDEQRYLLWAEITADIIVEVVCTKCTLHESAIHESAFQQMELYIAMISFVHQTSLSSNYRDCPPPPFVPNLEINPDFTLWNIPIINDQDPRCCTRENFLFPRSNAADSYNGHPYILVQKFLERERERIFAANLASLTFTQIYIKYKMEEELCNIYICPRFCPTKNTIRHEESKWINPWSIDVSPGDPFPFFFLAAHFPFITFQSTARATFLLTHSYTRFLKGRGLLDSGIVGAS